MNIFEQYISYGLSVFPCKDKRPNFKMLEESIGTNKWGRYKTKLPGEETKKWSGGVAIVCGKVSGGLWVFDFDVKYGDRWNEWVDLVVKDSPDLLSKVVVETTPSRGYHVYFRTNMDATTTKFARNKDGDAMIEAKGERGYVFCAPAEGYDLLFGDFSKIQTLTDEEVGELVSCAITLDEAPVVEYRPVERSLKAMEGLSPLDDYDARSDLPGLLERHGWKILSAKGSRVVFRRPGKDENSQSATWNHIPDRFYIFSTNSEPFQSLMIYKASAVYAILEHGGDFNAAAKSLYANKYGDRQIQSSLDKEFVVDACFFDKKEAKERIYSLRKSGYTKGLSVGIKCLDEYYTVYPGQLNILNGIPGHGKTLMMDTIAVNMAKNHGWKFAVFSPESYPVDIYYQKLIDIITKKPFSGHGKPTEMEFSLAVKFVEEHFYVFDPSKENLNLSSVLSSTEKAIKEKGVKATIIDPFNELESTKPKDLSTTEYIGQCLSKCRNFARIHQLGFWIVVHPRKMNRDKDGNTPVPDLYDVDGSAHWKNKADNGLCVWRNFEDNTTEIHVQKIKNRYGGKPGIAKLKYNTFNGCYEELTETEIEERKYYDEF